MLPTKIVQKRTITVPQKTGLKSPVLFCVLRSDFQLLGVLVFQFWKGVNVILRGLQITVTRPDSDHVNRDVPRICSPADKGMP